MRMAVRHLSHLGVESAPSNASSRWIGVYTLGSDASGERSTPARRARSFTAHSV